MKRKKFYILFKDALKPTFEGTTTLSKKDFEEMVIKPLQSLGLIHTWDCWDSLLLNDDNFQSLDDLVL